MAKYIDQSVAIARLTHLEVTKPTATMTDAKRALADMFPADVVAVVRCMKCRYYELGACQKIYSDGNMNKAAWQWREPDDFCSYGRRDISGGGIGKQAAQKWIFNGCATKCPHCGASFEVAQMDDGLELLYCPVCGKRAGGEAT